MSGNAGVRLLTCPQPLGAVALRPGLGSGPTRSPRVPTASRGAGFVPFATRQAADGPAHGSPALCSFDHKSTRCRVLP